jgi:hypothetical protein
LRPLGLEKGKPFEPDERQTEILTDAALVGEAMAKANSADCRFAGIKYRSDAHWDFALQLDADDPAGFWNLLDQRAFWFYEAVGAGPAMALKRPGPSSVYLSAFKDKAGKWPDGGTSYRLRVPPDPPVNLFWSVMVYDADTRALILNEQKIADRSSRMDLHTNEDGSVEIYCGPKAPPGFEKNWIPTVPDENWFAYFRFYQPTETYFDRSWPLPDFEQIWTALLRLGWHRNVVERRAHRDRRLAVHARLELVEDPVEVSCSPRVQVREAGRLAFLGVGGEVDQSWGG